MAWFNFRLLGCRNPACPFLFDEQSCWVTRPETNVESIFHLIWIICENFNDLYRDISQDSISYLKIQLCSSPSGHPRQLAQNCCKTEWLAFKFIEHRLCSFPILRRISEITVVEWLMTHDEPYMTFNNQRRTKLFLSRSLSRGDLSSDMSQDLLLIWNFKVASFIRSLTKIILP